jgi:hypothetical protein
MSPTHLLPPYHFNIHLKQLKHSEHGGSKFLKHDEYLTTTKNRNTRKKIFSSMQTFWPWISCCISISLSTNLAAALNMIHFFYMHWKFLQPYLQSRSCTDVLTLEIWCPQLIALLLPENEWYKEETYIMTDFSSGQAWSTSETEGCRLNCFFVSLFYGCPADMFT